MMEPVNCWAFLEHHPHGGVRRSGRARPGPAVVEDAADSGRSEADEAAAAAWLCRREAQPLGPTIATIFSRLDALSEHPVEHQRPVLGVEKDRFRVSIAAGQHPGTRAAGPYLRGAALPTG